MTNILQMNAPNAAKSAHVYRQIIATFAASLLSLAGGICFGFSAVLLPQLQADSDYPYDKSYDSWIASISPLAMMIGSIFGGPMSDGIGRRSGQLVLLVPFTAGWIIMGTAKNNTVMLIGRFVTGISTGSVRANSLVYIGELNDPKHRALALFCPSAAIHIGVLFSHLVGKYYEWKASCFIFALPNILSFVILLCMKESPLWLLSKGKTDEGIASFRQFRGTGDDAEKELATVLEKVKEKSAQNTKFKDTLNIIFSKPFLKSIVVICLLFISIQCCGVNTISFYAEMIFEKTFSGDADAVMLMLVTDFVRFAASVVICFVANAFPRKTTFVILSMITTIALIGVVIYLYIAPAGLVWIGITCMFVYIATGSALSSISWSFVAELFPSEVRGFGSGLSSSIAFILLFISVKVTPEILFGFGEKVLFASFAAVTLFTGIFLSCILPETNRRSLQEIENTLYKRKGEEKKDIGMVTLPGSSA